MARPGRRRCSWRAGPAAACAALLAAAAGGCGSGGEVEEGATVTVYAGTPVCAGAKRQLRRSGTEAGSVRVQVICLPPAESGGRLDLAAAGAGARRAAQDSRTVAFLEASAPAAPFIRAILEEPEIALVADSSGARGMTTILDALGARGGGETPRESVWSAR